ncbi:MAG: SapC family protein [uncultured bacterium]|nr:MAG: SapC family protein [uncultured bacterium]
MPNYQVISKASYGNKRWLRYTGYAFAMKDAVIPLTLAELPKAAMSLPIGFIAQGENFLPAAVMSLQSEKNLFVAPDGRWVQSYIPAACRSYPFILARTTEGQQVLCIDQDSGLVTEGEEGEAFFDEEGQPAKAVQDILQFLNSVEQSRQATSAACAVLAKHKLIQPWPIAVKTDAGEQKIEGLYRIDEAALNELPAEALVELRNANALTITYCQLLSMQHLGLLGELAKAHAAADAAKQAKAAKLPEVAGSLDLDFLKKSDSISFSGF